MPIFIIIRAFFCRCGPNCSERFQLLATIVRDDDVISTPIYVPILVSVPIFGVIGDFKNFDDVLATPSSPQPLAATGNLYFPNIHTEICLRTNFQLDRKILKISMTSWGHPRPTHSLSLRIFIFVIYIPSPSILPIFSLNGPCGPIARF